MKLLQWCKANAMPVIAVLAAAVTAVFVPPDSADLGSVSYTHLDVYKRQASTQSGPFH